MEPRILIVDDESMIRRALEKYLVDLQYEVVTAGNYDEAMAQVAGTSIDCALIDLVMPGRGGIDLVQALRDRDPEMAAIVMTGFGTIATAVEAMKSGAFHYLTKPFELEDIRHLVSRALEYRMLRSDNRTLKHQLHKRYRFENIIGSSEAMSEVFDLVEKIADSDSTVLLLGESGTGKELIARAIHYNCTRRCERPLITVNCAAIPEDLLEAELFGYVRGAFTGATTTHRGKFEAAHGGSIFLDEIGDMSPKLQVKLLRALQERRFEPVGSTRTQEVDVRIIAATNQDLEQRVKEGRFREDLYYRLNVIPLQLPPLRAREGDVDILMQSFLERFNAANDRSVSHIADDALDVMRRYPWPGNVRELENLMERLVVLKGDGVIGMEDLPPHVRNEGWHFKAPSVDIPDRGLSLKQAVMVFEHELIQRALRKSGGNKNRAAGLLQLNRTTLVEKLKKQEQMGLAKNHR